MDSSAGLTISDSSEDFSTWMGKAFVPDSLREPISQANLLFVPMENFRGASGPVFYSGTSGLFRFLKEKGGEQIIPELCVSDEQYQEVSLHGAMHRYGKIR